MEHPLAQGTGNTRDSSEAKPDTVRERAICAGLGWLGIIGAIAFISPFLLMAGGWSPQGTAEFHRYLTPTLALMACGFIGLNLCYRKLAGRLFLLATLVVIGGFAVMMVWNVAEFWFNASTWAELIFLAGLLIALTGSPLLGVSSWRSITLPQWAKWLFVLAPAATIIALIIEALTGASLYPLPLLALFLVTLAAGIVAARRTRILGETSIPATMPPIP